MGELVVIGGAAAVTAAEAGAATAGAAAVTSASTAAAATAATTAAASSLTLAEVFNGLSLAWSIGSTIYSMFGGGAASVTGAKLKDTQVQSTAYGGPIKRFWGVDRMSGLLVWVGHNGKGGRGIRTHESTEGKGGGGAPPVYRYDVDLAILINGASNCRGVRKIWADTKLIYDVSLEADLASRVGTGQKLGKGRGNVTFYDGNEDQEPPALIEELAGVGNTSAYRNVFLAVFEKFALEDFGNRIPNFSFECFTDGEEEFQELHKYDLEAYGYDIYQGVNISWSKVDGNGEVKLLVGLAGKNYQNGLPPGGPLSDQGKFAFETYLLDAEGNITPIERVATLTSDASLGGVSVGGNIRGGRADEHGYVTSSGGHTIWWPFETNIPVVMIGGGGKFWKGGDSRFITYNENNAEFLEYHSDSGVLLREIAWDVLNDGEPVDYMGTESGFWVFCSPSVSSTITDTLIYRLSWDDFLIQETITLSSSLGLFVFDVQDDGDTIYLMADAPAGEFGFYKWTEATGAVLLGTGGSGMAPRTSVLQVLHESLWYYSEARTTHAFDRLENVWVFAPGVETNCVALWKIVRDICIACGLDEEDIDVSELTDCVEGYTIDTQMGGRDAILPLQRAFFFDGRESDLQIDFLKRGHEAVATIPEADMAARPSTRDPLPPILDITRGQETELPIRLHVKFKDIEANYQVGHATTTRLTSESRHNVTVDLPVVMDSSKAKQVCNVLMANYWLERAPKEIRVSRKYMLIDAADPINLEMQA